MILRDYQIECLDKIKDKASEGVINQAVSLPCGTGKTVTFCAIPKWIGSTKKWLFVAHRYELIEQIANTLKNYYPSSNIGVEMADQEITGSKLYNVASVPTIGRGRNNKRLQKFNPMEFDGIVFDECHHSAAQSYIHVFEYFKRINPHILTLGFSATLERSDKLGLDHIFDEIVYHKTILEMIKKGYLCNIRAYKVNSNVDIDGIKMHMGDFSQKELSERVNTYERNLVVAKAIKEHSGIAQGIAFTSSVEHSIDLADMLNKMGIKTAHLSGITPDMERKKILDDYRFNRIQWITNFGILTEGTDLPNTYFVAMARPTKSKLLYTQIIGRALRLHPGKHEATILDVCDVTSRHSGSLMTIPSLLGDLPSDFDVKGRTITDTIKAVDEAVKVRPEIDKSRLKNLADVQTALEELDIFNIHPIQDPTINTYSNFSWQEVRGNFYITPVFTTIYAIRHYDGKYKMFKNDEYLGQAESLKAAMNFCDTNIRHSFPDKTFLIDKHAKWKQHGATPAQKLLLAQKNIKFDPFSITKGEAGTLLDRLGIQTLINRFKLAGAN